MGGIVTSSPQHCQFSDKTCNDVHGGHVVEQGALMWEALLKIPMQYTGVL